MNRDTSALSTLKIEVDLSRFFCLAKRGDRSKHRNVTEIERIARREKIDKATPIFKFDSALVSHANSFFHNYRDYLPGRLRRSGLLKRGALTRC